MKINLTPKISLLIILFLCVQSCKKESSKELVKLDLSNTPDLIEGELINVEQFISPGKMEIEENLIFVSDSKSEKFIHVFDLENLEYIGNIGTKGKGPGEALSCVSLDVNDGKIWLQGITLAKLISFNIDSILTQSKDYKYEEEILMKEKARQNFSPRWLDDGSIASISFSESLNRIMYTNKNGEVFKEDFVFLNPEDKDVPRSIHNMSYQGVQAIHPSLNKTVIVSRYADLIEIYNHDDLSSKLVKTHQNFNPIYEVVNSGGGVRMSQGDDTRFGYIDAAVTEDKIFTLYSGRTRGEGFANYAKNIYVYDWEGNYLDSYQISNLAIAIASDSNNNFYTMEYKDGIPMLKKYNSNEK